MEVVAQRGRSALVALTEPGEEIFDQTLAVVVDRRTNTVHMPRNLHTILAHGYWIPWEGDEQPVLALVSDAMVAAGFVEADHPRHPAGTERGGEFARKEGALSGLKNRELQGTPQWLKGEALDEVAALYKATRQREAVEIARGWLQESGVTEHQGIPVELLNQVGVVGAMNEHYPDGWEFFLSINDMHKEDFRRNYMVNGEYVPERLSYHNGIRTKYLSTARLPAPGEQPVALFMAGGSGAGKSSILGKQGEDGNFSGGTIAAPDGSVYINPDDIKELLPEAKVMRDSGDTRWAALAHEESSDIAARLRKDAEQVGFPMVVDGTGDAAPGKFLGKIRDAENAGYRTKVVFVDIPTDEAIRRADIRAQETGRRVSHQAIRDIHRNVTARHLEWRDEVGDWEVWANDDAEQGGRRLIARREAGGPIEVVDQERYAQMEAKGR